MFSGLGNLGSLLAQAGQIRQKMEALGQDLRTRRVSGAAGGGMVQVEINGAMEVLGCTIAPELLERKDREMLEDLVCAATNQALERAREAHAEAMRELTGGLNIPGLSDALSQLGGMRPS